MPQLTTTCTRPASGWLLSVCRCVRLCSLIMREKHGWHMRFRRLRRRGPRPTLSDSEVLCIDVVGERLGSRLPCRRLADAEPEERPVNLGDMLGRNFGLASV